MLLGVHHLFQPAIQYLDKVCRARAIISFPPAKRLKLFPKPRVVVSRCLGFEACRYDGSVLRDRLVELLESHVEFVDLCPEAEIGLGTPRLPVRLVQAGKERKLLQPGTEVDATSAMQRFIKDFLRNAGEVDGFVLKSRSPSCGISDVKLYATTERAAAIGKGAGMFGTAVLENFPNAAIEDEGRLRNFNLREHFLIKIFTLARYRASVTNRSVSAMTAFHASHKFILMAYHQQAMREMGRILANPDKKSWQDVESAYRDKLHTALARPARHTSHCNVLEHALGYVSDGLSPSERRHFLATLERYRKGRLPLSSVLAIVRSWIARFQQPYLAQQQYFEPFPEDLIELSDSGKPRLD